MAQEQYSSSYRLVLGLNGGVQAGNAHEYVFAKQGTYTLSDLDWPLMPSWSWGLIVRLESDQGFTVALEARSGIPVRTGTITDKDFLNYDGNLTHVSSHDAWLEEGSMADLGLGWKIRLSSAWSLKPELGFRFDSFQWSAQNGYLQYPPQGSAPYSVWTTDREKIPFYGKGITYLQYWYLPYLALVLAWEPAEYTELRLRMKYGPYIIANTIDNHFVRDLAFYDYLYGGVYLAPSFNFTWQAPGALGLDLGLSWQGAWSEPGTSYALEVGSGGELKNHLSYSEKAAGATLQYLELQISMIMTSFLDPARN